MKIPCGREKSVTVVVRTFEPSDALRVQEIWTDGFLELSEDMTRNLAPVLSENWIYNFPRPLCALGIVIGTSSALYGALKRNRAVTMWSFAVALGGFFGLFAIHRITTRFIREMCYEAVTVGDMSRISSELRQSEKKEFFVATLLMEDHSVVVVGCTAIAVDESDPTVCVVSKVSCDRNYRGHGVARALMLEAERWAVAVNAKRIRLTTANSGAKAFYAKLGYELESGSMYGASFSTWTKQLQ